MKRANNEYECRTCDGTGEDRCECCENEIDCADCNGTGYNERLDKKRLEEALRQATMRWGGACQFIENGFVLGYMPLPPRGKTDNGERVLFKDYEKQPANAGEGSGR